MPLQSAIIIKYYYYLNSYLCRPLYEWPVVDIVLLSCVSKFSMPEGISPLCCAIAGMSELSANDGTGGMLPGRQSSLLPLEMLSSSLCPTVGASSVHFETPKAQL